MFVASAAYSNFDDATIAVVSLKDHRRKTLLEHAGMHARYLPGGHLVYVTKGTLFAVPFDLDRLEVRGPATMLQEVSSDPIFGYAQIDFSPSGVMAYRKGRALGLSTPMAGLWFSRRLEACSGRGRTEPARLSR